MNDIKFKKTNGGLGRQAASEDPVSGLLVYMPNLSYSALVNSANAKIFDIISLPDGTAVYAAKFRYPEEMADCGIVMQPMDTASLNAIPSVSDTLISARSSMNTLHYHISEFFRMNPEGTLYVGVVVDLDGTSVNADQVDALQRYANGSIRQMGIINPTATAATTANINTLLTSLQTGATALEGRHMPLSLLYATGGKNCTFSKDGNNDWKPAYTAVASLQKSKLASTTDADKLIVSGRCNVSFVACCDVDPQVIENLGHYAYYGCIGAALGAVSAAAVNECIAWVGKFPVSLTKPGLISGEGLSEVSDADQDKINSNRYIFVRTYVGDSNNYFNDSFTLDVETSDYSYIENVRTIDKACRGVYKNLLPWLNSPILVDARSGKMDSGFVSFLETTAGAALEDMEKAGELSGYKAEVDPEQNVLATSMVEVVIRNVPTGTMRKVNVKIGFVTSI